MSESQRAAVAAKLANLTHGQRADQVAQICASAPVTQDQAADMLNVSYLCVQAAAKVQGAGVPELSAALDAGEVSVSAAAAGTTFPTRD